MKDLGSEVVTYQAIKGQVASGEAVSIFGHGIDRKGYDGAVFALTVGDTSGTPTRFGVIFKAQEADVDSHASYSDISGATATVSGATAVTQAQLQKEFNVNLKATKRYIRLVATPSFYGGSSPKVEIGAVCILGEAKVLPV